MSPKSKLDRFAVVAKHKIYFADVKSQFQTYPIDFDYYNDLDELVGAKANAEYKYIFFFNLFANAIFIGESSNKKSCIKLRVDKHCILIGS